MLFREEVDFPQKENEIGSINHFFKMVKTSYKVHIPKHSKHSLITTKITLSTSKHKLR